MHVISNRFSAAICETRAWNTTVLRVALLVLGLAAASMITVSGAQAQFLPGLTDHKASATAEADGADQVPQAAGGNDTQSVPIGSDGMAASDKPLLEPRFPGIGNEMVMGKGAILLEARENLSRVISRVPDMPFDIQVTLEEASQDGSFRWLAVGVATAVGGLALGLGIYKLITGYLRRAFANRREIRNPTRSQKLSFLLMRALLLLGSTIVMFSIAIVVAVIFDSGHEPTRVTIFSIVSSYAIYRVLRYVILFNFFAPDLPALRMIRLDDKRAKRLYADWYVAIAISVTVIGTVRWLHGLGVLEDTYHFIFIAGSAFSALLIAILTIRHRRDLIEVMRGSAATRESRRIREALAMVLVPMLLLYVTTAWVTSTIRLALGLPGGYLLVSAPIIVFFVAVFIYGIAILGIEIFYERRAQIFRRRSILNRLRESRRARRAAERAAQGARQDAILSGEISVETGKAESGLEIMPTIGVGEGEEMVIFQKEEKAKTETAYKPVFKSFFEGAIGAVIVVMALGELAKLWGLELGREGGHPFARILDAALVVWLALLLMRSVNEYVNMKIIEEGGSIDEGPVTPGGEGEGGVGQTRMATLLPMFRAVLAGLLVIVGSMMVLSSLGVDIGPLFAGAGVIGIAIGFGAQTLIRDIFSGFFFLIDDAFRKGEYIEVGNVRGVIEKISIRSFQLRHHLGAIHTVPFGEIHQLTNFSRDWVIMKLPLRLTYGTDVEKVRKLVKKIGIDLLEDPTVGHMFLQPLKSQGVQAMEDSAMIIRVKFMTKPGDQFMVRKMVYAAIRETFEREGIQFAHREVTVRLADAQDPKKLSLEERETVAGSVRTILDEENQKSGSSMAAAAAAR